MARLYGTAEVGKKNIMLGVLLFAVMGVLMGIPLTVDFFGGTMLSTEQYAVWKVVHGYGVFLGFINFFFGFGIDRVNLTRRQKEVSSWCFLLAGVVGGFGRMALALLGTLDQFGVIASLGEVAFFVVGTAVFIYGQMGTTRLASAAA
jgi:hypothetical protein